MALHNQRALLLDPYVKEFSGRLIWVPLYASIAFVVLRMYGLKRGLLILAVIGISVGCSDFVCARLIRPVVERLRPANLDNPLSAMVHVVQGYRGGSYGFPSCHATNTFALAVASSIAIRKRWYSLFIFIWAVLQCHSRVYLGVHYPGDLLVGASIGAALGYLGMYLSRRIWWPAPPAPDTLACIPLIVGILTFSAIGLIAWL